MSDLKAIEAAVDAAMGSHDNWMQRQETRTALLTHLHAWKVQYDEQAAELARVRGACQAIHDRFILALGRGEQATGDLVSEMAGLATAALAAELAESNKRFEEHLEAWKANNAFFGGWCERFIKELDTYRDAWEPDFSPVSQAMDEYKTARAGR